jgi:hypothetical protein
VDYVVGKHRRIKVVWVEGVLTTGVGSLVGYKREASGSRSLG